MIYQIKGKVLFSHFDHFFGRILPMAIRLKSAQFVASPTSKIGIGNWRKIFLEQTKMTCQNFLSTIVSAGRGTEFRNSKSTMIKLFQYEELYKNVRLLLIGAQLD